MPISNVVDYRHNHSLEEECKVMRMGSVYRLTYFEGKLIQISEVEKDCSVAKFHQKFDANYRVEERNKVWAQTLLTDEEAMHGQGIVYTLMNPAYGIYLKEEDINLHRIEMHYGKKRMKK